MENPNFLKQKYNLHNAPEVASAAARTEKQTGEKVPQDPEKRIQNYLDRLERLILDPNKEQKIKIFGNESRPRALSLLREMIMNKYIRPNKEKMAEGAARVEERAARELGFDVHYGEQELAQRGDIAVEDLEKSLDNWIAYLSDANEPYPTWFRYYAFRNVLDLGDYDKDKGEFSKRSQGTVRLFPDIDRGALAYIQDIIEASKDPATFERLRKAQEAAGTPYEQLLTKEKAANFAKLSFAKQYADGIRQAGEITPEMREETEGKWIKYQEKTDPTALWASLQNKGAAWCTKGFATAETQLKNGDFYVYYTLDKQGKPTIPRIAIRMQENQIFEVRGTADNQQNLESNMADIAEKKINELPGAEKYRKASADMKQLTNIENKMAKGQELTKDDLIFLYEINSPIEYFGYQKDPRIKELRDKRNQQTDASIALECESNQIARNQQEINENTKAYIGPLFPDIFKDFQYLEHIYISFPEDKIKKEKITTGGKTAEQLERELKKAQIKISPYAQEMMHKTTTTDKYGTFTTTKETKTVDFVRTKIKDLFNEVKNHTFAEICAKAKELGLELCESEDGPNYRLHYTNQPPNEWLWMGMKQISDSGGYPHVFGLDRDGGDGSGELWLRGSWTYPALAWYSGSEFVFRPSQ